MLAQAKKRLLRSPVLVHKTVESTLETEAGRDVQYPSRGANTTPFRKPGIHTSIELQCEDYFVDRLRLVLE